MIEECLVKKLNPVWICLYNPDGKENVKENACKAISDGSLRCFL
jgi:hypothetical protein